MSTPITESKRRGRPSKFDREELLGRVLDLFWERGYRALSLNEIASATGVSRASLYNAFESKEALFLETLDMYLSSMPSILLRDLEEGQAVTPSLYKVFDTLCYESANDEKRRGCLLVNLLSDTFSTAEPVVDMVQPMIDDYLLWLKGLITRAVDQGELPSETNAEITTNLLWSFMCGFSTFTKSGGDETTFKLMTDQFLGQLGFKRP